MKVRKGSLPLFRKESGGTPPMQENFCELDASLIACNGGVLWPASASSSNKCHLRSKVRRGLGRDRNSPSPLNFPLFVNQHGGESTRLCYIREPTGNTCTTGCFIDDSPFCAKPVGSESHRLRLTIGCQNVIIVLLFNWLNMCNKIIYM